MVEPEPLSGQKFVPVSVNVKLPGAPAVRSVGLMLDIVWAVALESKKKAASATARKICGIVRFIKALSGRRRNLRRMACGQSSDLSRVFHAEWIGSSCMSTGSFSLAWG